MTKQTERIGLNEAARRRPELLPGAEAQDEMLTQSATLKCNGLAECPVCESVQYVQTEMDDTATIRTCHECEKSWRSGRGRLSLEYAVEIEVKYLRAYPLLEVLHAPEAVRNSKYRTVGCLRRCGYEYDKVVGNWK